VPELSTEFWIGTAFAALSLVLGLGVTLAMDARTKGEFRFATTCFVISAGLVACGILEWQMSTSWSAWPRVLITYILLAATVLLAGEAIRWAKNRHIRATVEPEPDAGSGKRPGDPAMQHGKPGPQTPELRAAPLVDLGAYLQPDEPYPAGMPLAGIVWRQEYVDVRLDIANGAIAIQNLDFLIRLDTSIAGIGQLSQFPGVTAFPANAPPERWLRGTDLEGNPVSVPITPIPGTMNTAPIYRVHCSEIFANTVVHLVVASAALNPLQNGQLPKQLFALRRAPMLIQIKGGYETRKGGGDVENHTLEWSYRFPRIGKELADGGVAQLSVSERPYVIAESVIFIDDDKKVRVEYHNSGKTPAIDLGLSVRFLIANSFDLNAVTPAQLSQPTGYGNVAADQRIATDVDSHKEDHPAEFGLAKKGQLDCYAFGFLRYKDLAGRSYEPRYCFRWSAQDQAFVQCPANVFVKGQKL